MTRSLHIAQPPRPSRLDLHARASGETRIVVASGELDIETAHALATLLGAVTREGAQDVVIDLSGIGFIDSTGLAVLINAKRRTLRAGGSMRLVANTAPVRRLLETTRLDRDLETFPTLRAALAA